MKQLLLTLGLAAGAGCTAQAQIANAGLETWHEYVVMAIPPATLEAPNSWNGADSLITGLSVLFGFEAQKQLYKTTDAHSGTHAARLVTKEQGSLLGMFPGILLNAKPSFNIMDSAFAFGPATAISGWVDTVYAWAKYESGPGGDDNGQMTALLYKAEAGEGGADSLVGTGVSDILPGSTYTQQHLKVFYTSPLQPDKLVLIFSSSPFDPGSLIGGSAVEGSTLYVDDVSMVMTTLGVPQAQAGLQLEVYPNPTSDALNIRTTQQNTPLKVSLFSAAGKLMAEQTFEQQTTIRTADFANGLYFYQVADHQNRVLQNGKVTIAR